MIFSPPDWSQFYCLSCCTEWFMFRSTNGSAIRANCVYLLSTLINGTICSEKATFSIFPLASRWEATGVSKNKFWCCKISIDCGCLFRLRLLTSTFCMPDIVTRSISFVHKPMIADTGLFPQWFVSLLSHKWTKEHFEKQTTEQLRQVKVRFVSYLDRHGHDQV